MICIVACIAAHAVLADAAVAAPNPVQPAFGNTIVSTYPDGRKAMLWLRPDGDYSIKGRRGDRSSGHWSIRGAKLCLKQARPFAVPFNFCSPFPTSLTSGSWTAKAFTGETVLLQLTPGDAGSGPAN
jgi:hypothetical protein